MLRVRFIQEEREKMSTKDKILDDIAQFAGGTLGVLQGTKEQVKTTMRSGIDSLAQDLDLVPREDFENLEAMVIKARQEQDTLLKRVEELEKQLRSKK